MSNIQTVQRIYTAFGQGDIPTILAQLAEDVDWEYGRLDAGVPWLRPRKGRAEVAQFFETLRDLDFQKFQPKTFLENGNIVVALIDLAFHVKSTGKSVMEEDEAQIWHFDSEGRVIRYCHKLDSHQHWLAAQGK